MQPGMSRAVPTPGCKAGGLCVCPSVLCRDSWGKPCQLFVACRKDCFYLFQACIVSWQCKCPLKLQREIKENQTIWLEHAHSNPSMSEVTSPISTPNHSQGSPLVNKHGLEEKVKICCNLLQNSPILIQQNAKFSEWWVFLIYDNDSDLKQ